MSNYDTVDETVLDRIAKLAANVGDSQPPAKFVVDDVPDAAFGYEVVEFTDPRLAAQYMKQQGGFILPGRASAQFNKEHETKYDIHARRRK